MNGIVHGGTGSTPEEPDPRRAVLDEAARAGAKAGRASNSPGSRSDLVHNARALDRSSEARP